MDQGNLIRTLHWLRGRAENVAVLLLFLMFVSFLVQIFSRYILNAPVGWTDEVSILCWIWTVLWGAAFLISEKEEVRFDIFYSAVSEKVRRIFTIVSGLILIALYGISLPAAYKYVAFMKVERSAYLKIPMNYLYAIYVIFAVACLCRYVWLVWNAIRGGPSPSTDPAQLSD
ncbi:TRAP transporter small permease [Rhodopseudomonas sp. P2A-2r]|uniref:TRAP transporter small permease n=1 Tax=unclassified Rhodopseudomonas TaxID=2638247 RepID=UPI0022348811|nr:TRAP transporter small permease [Rhodopseudomonas sp. P2A-2r]UZE50618.1 TRAP transporter small permease [Rhodopseudomonas sp. P2A-2r]